MSKPEGSEYIPPFVYPRDARIAVFVLKQIRNANPDHGSLTIDQAIELFSPEDGVVNTKTTDFREPGFRFGEVHKNRADAVFFTLLQPNEDQTGWEFPSLYDPTTLEQIFPDKLDGLDPETYARKINGLRGNAFDARNRLVQNIENIEELIPALAKNYRALLEELRKNPLFAKSTNEEIVGYILRKLPFPIPQAPDPGSPFLDHLLALRNEVRYPRIGSGK